MELSGVQPGDDVSIAVDAMAMTADRACLAAKSSNYLFVYYAQPLSRPGKCLALPVFRDTSGQAGETVQFSFDQVCQARGPAKFVFDMSVLIVILVIISVVKSFSVSGIPSS
jgi:hypothetical protein